MKSSLGLKHLYKSRKYIRISWFKTWFYFKLIFEWYTNVMLFADKNFVERLAGRSRLLRVLWFLYRLVKHEEVNSFYPHLWGALRGQKSTFDKVFFGEEHTYLFIFYSSRTWWYQDYWRNRWSVWFTFGFKTVGECIEFLSYAQYCLVLLEKRLFMNNVEWLVWD